MGKNILKNAYRVKREGTSYNSEKSSHRNIQYSSYLPFSVNGYGGDSHGGASAATVLQRIFGADSGFHVGQCTTGGGLISGFQDFFGCIGKAFILARGLGAGL